MFTFIYVERWSGYESGASDKPNNVEESSGAFYCAGEGRNVEGASVGQTSEIGETEQCKTTIHLTIFRER